MAEYNPGWEELSKKYRIYMQLERGFSGNTIESYMRDVEQFGDFAAETYGARPLEIVPDMVEEFMGHLFDRGAEKTTQARILSGVKSFYKFLLIEGLLDRSPAEFIDHPKGGHSLPDTLSLVEIDAVLDSIDLSTPHGRRNRAMLETLYSCGLRVSELVSLSLSDLFLEEGFIRVLGKGSKQRLVPVSCEWRRRLDVYLDDRAAITPDHKSADILFLNRRGGKLSRVMVFNIIKDAVRAAGIEKNVSPHTFRHSFATHLMQGGAGIRQVQELLGHESITTTEVYTHLDSGHLERTLAEHHMLGDAKKD